MLLDLKHESVYKYIDIFIKAMSDTNIGNTENKGTQPEENPPKKSFWAALKDDSVNNPLETILTIATVLLAIFTYALWVSTNGLLQSDIDKSNKAVDDMKESLRLTKQSADAATSAANAAISSVNFTQKIADATAVQSQAILKQTNAAIFRDKAFINILNPTFSFYPPNKPTRVAIQIIGENIGSLPANKVIIQYDCPHFNKSKNITDPFPFAEWKKAIFSNLIGARKPFDAQGCEIPGEIWNAAAALNIDLFYLVKVSYMDGITYSPPRITQMSRVIRFDKEGGISFSYAGKHNCYDEDCPKK